MRDQLKSGNTVSTLFGFLDAPKLRSSILYFEEMARRMDDKELEGTRLGVRAGVRCSCIACLCACVHALLIPSFLPLVTLVDSRFVRFAS